MRVVMIGAGYVGLVSGACFADFGHAVTCVDKDASRIARLEQGIMPIHEPGLEALVASNVREGRLSFARNSALIPHLRPFKKPLSKERQRGPDPSRSLDPAQHHHPRGQREP